MRRWFDKGEEDGLIRRRLKMSEVGGENTDYTVTVVTSDLRGAGTDAKVYLEITGENGGKEVRRCLKTSKCAPRLHPCNKCVCVLR
jgi:hypothetical protein